jgi:hypothetical protein
VTGRGSAGRRFVGRGSVSRAGRRAASVTEALLGFLPGERPGYDLAIPVMFSPTAKGTFTFHYVFHWKDRLGNHSLTVVLTGKGV